MFLYCLSKFAKSTIPGPILFSIGTYLIYRATFLSPKGIIFDIDFIIGIGLILPHTRFFLEWIHKTYTSLKYATINSYYFLLTVYLKIRNFILWFYYAFLKIQAFFSKERQSYDNKQRAKERQRQREKQKQEEDFSYEEAYEEYQKQSNNYEEKSSSYKYNSSYDKKDYSSYSQSESNNYNDEFSQFFSNNHYEVLGASPNDSLEAIKKKYRKLVFKYHPDQNNQDEHCSEISKRINVSYDYLKRNHKK